MVWGGKGDSNPRPSAWEAWESPPPPARLYHPFQNAEPFPLVSPPPYILRLPGEVQAPDWQPNVIPTERAGRCGGCMGTTVDSRRLRQAARVRQVCDGIARTAGRAGRIWTYSFPSLIIVDAKNAPGRAETADCLDTREPLESHHERVQGIRRASGA